MKVHLPPRFHEPMTPELLAELDAYAALRDAEIERVRRVLAYFKENGLIKKKPRLKAA